MVPMGWTVSMCPAIRMPGSPCFGCGKRARITPPKPWRPAMRSIVAPMIAISRAARSSMRSTAPASQVGLSHSTQPRRPCSMDSESKGRLAGFMRVLPVFDAVFLAAVHENEGCRNCKAKTRCGIDVSAGKAAACSSMKRLSASAQRRNQGLGFIPGKFCTSAKARQRRMFPSRSAEALLPLLKQGASTHLHSVTRSPL